MKKNRVLQALGRNVRRMRDERSLTQEALAENSDLDPTYISGIERGVRNASILSIARLARGLDATCADICRGIDK